MASYALWSWRYITKPLMDTYSTAPLVAGAFNLAQIVAIEAHIIEQPLNGFSPNAPDPTVSVNDLKNAIGLLHSPVLLILYTPQATRAHAVIAYEYHYRFRPNGLTLSPIAGDSPRKQRRSDRGQRERARGWIEDGPARAKHVSPG